MKFEPIMTTNSGKKINPADMQYDDIDLKDIAHHLSMINRFGGAARLPLNVAQHSVYVYRLVADQTLAIRRQALLHDASEAYLGDIIKWLKESKIFEGYRKVEADLEQRIWIKFECELVMHPSVKAADKLMARLEAFNCMSGMDTPKTDNYMPITEAEIKDVEKKADPWYPWGWRQAKWEFLGACKEVGIYDGELPGIQWTPNFAITGPSY